MANISTYIQAIETASRGEEVRDSIVAALEAINTGAGSVPIPTASEAGKYLSVDSTGAWIFKELTSAEGVSF